jgi:P pilus assembly chaperone PapD
MFTNKPTYPLSIIFLLIFSYNCIGQGDLMVMPKRLVFDGSQRAQEITLVNTGKDTAVYAISFIQYKMTEEGNFEQITTPEENQHFADEFLRYYPRRVSLGPNEAQTVRVQLTKTSRLENGEYRSHLYFRAVEEQTALGTNNDQDSEGISININTVFGISIPVIIRNGEPNTQIDLTNIHLNHKDEENHQLTMTINRNGNMSVYGDLLVEHISTSGKIKEIKRIKGISVYTPNTRRNFVMEIQEPKKLDFKKGKLRITYTSDSGSVLTVSELNLE